METRGRDSMETIKTAGGRKYGGLFSLSNQKLSWELWLLLKTTLTLTQRILAADSQVSALWEQETAPGQVFSLPLMTRPFSVLSKAII